MVSVSTLNEVGPMSAMYPMPGVAAVVEQSRGRARQPQRREVGSVFERCGVTLHLDAGDILVSAGEVKGHIYRVEKGRLHALWHDPETGTRSVAFAFAGDLVGLGSLAKTSVTIEAATDAVVRCVPRTALDEVLAEDEQLAAQHARATESELALLRERLVSEGRANALVRAAALLSVLAATAGYEGRDPTIVADDLTCGFVADQLGLDIATLQRALLDLRQRGVIEPLANGGLRLANPTEIDRLAAGLTEPDPAPANINELFIRL